MDGILRLLLSGDLEANVVNNWLIDDKTFATVPSKHDALELCSPTSFKCFFLNCFREAVQALVLAADQRKKEASQHNTPTSSSAFPPLPSATTSREIPGAPLPLSSFAGSQLASSKVERHAVETNNITAPQTGSRRRKIAPTRVATVEVDVRFALAQVSGNGETPKPTSLTTSSTANISPSLGAWAKPPALVPKATICATTPDAPSVHSSSAGWPTATRQFSSGRSSATSKTPAPTSKNSKPSPVTATQLRNDFPVIALSDASTALQQPSRPPGKEPRNAWQKPQSSSITLPEHKLNSISPQPVDGPATRQHETQCQLRDPSRVASSAPSKVHSHVQSHCQGDATAPPTSKKQSLTVDVLHLQDVPCSCSVEAFLGPGLLALSCVHSSILCTPGGVCLPSELELLFLICTVSPTVKVPTSGDSTKPFMLCCGTTAAKYAVSVLQQTGGLLLSCHTQMLDALMDCPSVQCLPDDMMKSLQATVRQAQAGACASDDVIGKAAEGLSALMLTGQLHDGQVTRSQEEQQVVSNRESCRDAWLAIMREAAQLSNTLSAQGGATHSAADEGEVMSCLQGAGTQLIRSLRQENFGHFADMFTAAVLQAAATGETILDEELSSLVQRDPKKFAHLTQRFQQESNSSLDRMRGLTQKSGAGSVRGGTSTAKDASRSTGTRSRSDAFAISVGTTHLAISGAESAHSAAMQLMQHFAKPIRLYAMFLEAIDSHRLNSAVSRAMSRQLHRLLAEGSNVMAAWACAQRVAATTTLGLFLSYITFATGGSFQRQGSSGQGAGCCGYDGSHPVDAASLLLRSAQAGGVVWTLPALMAYLRLLGHDSAALEDRYFRRVMGMLHSLADSAALSPSNPHFNAAALCMRCALDEWRLAVGARVNNCALQMADDEPVVTAVLAALREVPSSMLDVRFNQLCCPTLEATRVSLQVCRSVSLNASAARPKTIRKITPTLPSAAQPTPTLQLPDDLAALVEEPVDPITIKLQAALFAQYSTPQHQVKLRDIVGECSRIVSLNATSLALKGVVSAVVEGGAVNMGEVARRWCAAAGVNSSVTREDMKVAVESAAHGIAMSGARQAVIAASDMVHEYIRCNVVRALVALAPPDFGEATIGAAAAIAAESAERSCLSALVAQLPAEVKQQLLRRVDGIVSAVMKEYISRQAATDHPPT